jgi:UDP-GlcNAc3NAcA epimerase
MPEEINRVVADHVSALLLCPTATAVSHLADEGITAGVHHVGDVMYDTTVAAVERAKGRSRILERLGLEPGSYGVATIHRAENTDDPERFARIVAYLADAASRMPLVLPLHPRTAKLLEAGRDRDCRLASAPIRLIEPLGYLDMTWLVHHAAGVFTDSGGLQKEAYFHRVPCVTLRDETEWVETIEAGWNRLWIAPEAVVPRRDIADYGDGRAAQQIVALIARQLGIDTTALWSGQVVS